MLLLFETSRTEQYHSASRRGRWRWYVGGVYLCVLGVEADADIGARTVREVTGISTSAAPLTRLYLETVDAAAVWHDSDPSYSLSQFVFEWRYLFLQPCRDPVDFVPDPQDVAPSDFGAVCLADALF